MQAAALEAQRGEVTSLRSHSTVAAPTWGVGTMERGRVLSRDLSEATLLLPGPVGTLACGLPGCSFWASGQRDSLGTKPASVTGGSAGAEPPPKPLRTQRAGRTEQGQ